MIILGLGAAFLQNDSVALPFSVYNSVSCVCQIFIIVFLFSLPKKEVSFVHKSENGIKPPRLQLLGFMFLTFSTGIMICFASNYAESIKNGVSVLYTGLVFGTVLFLILLKKGISMIKILRVLYFLAMFGFVVALSSETFLMLKHTACFILGMSFVCVEFYSYYGISVFTRYPSKWLAPITAVTALFAAEISMSLLSALRENITVLYGIYAAVSAAFVIVYSFLEPIFQFRIDDAKLSVNVVEAILNDKNAENEIDENCEPVTSASDYSEPPAEIEFDENRESETELVGFSELTFRENELAELLLQGYTESTICEVMNISVNTQKSYRKSVYNKLDIHSKRELFEKYERTK